MYVYEGKDYSKEPSREDKKAFDQLLELQKALTEETSKGGRALRNKANVRQKTWQGTWCCFICLWKMRLTVFSLYLQFAEGMLKDLDVNVVEMALESEGLTIQDFW